MSIFSNRRSTAESVGIAVAVQLGSLFGEAGMTGVLFTQRAWVAPTPPPVCRDFWRDAYDPGRSRGMDAGR